MAGPKRHGHGTPACGYRGCPREECQEAKRRRASRNRANLERGIPGMVDAAPIRKLLKTALRRKGTTITGIARSAGMSEDSVQKIASGGTQKIRVANAAKLQGAVSRGQNYRAGRGDPKKARRRYQALIAQGWSRDWVAAELGKLTGGRWCHPTGIPATLRAASVHEDLDAALKTLADRVGCTTGPCKQGATYGKRVLGYKTTAEWDGDFDDVERVDLPDSRTAPFHDRREEVRRMTLAGKSSREIALALLQREDENALRIIARDRSALREQGALPHVSRGEAGLYDPSSGSRQATRLRGGARLARSA